jgi:hypothetical protein
MFRPFHARNDYKTRIQVKNNAEKANAVAMSNRHYPMPNANAVRDVPHVCFCAKKQRR